MAMATVRKRAPGPLKVERAYYELRRMIITHELPPGATIDERELMDQLRVGRTPLREAMLRLSYEHLIVRSPRRGAWVSHLSLTQVQQLNEVRRLIEPPIARLAANRVTADSVDQLRSILKRTEQHFADGAFGLIADGDLEFHISLGNLAGNDYLKNFSLEINMSLLRYWQLFFRSSDTADIWYQSHRDLVDLIANGDADGAEAEVHRQIDVYLLRMHKFII